MQGKSQVTVQAKRGILAQGWAPGDDMGETAQTIELPIGGIARLNRTEGYMQNSPTLALFVADGTLDIVDDKDFEKAKPHAKIIQEFNDAQTVKREKKAMVGMDGHLSGMRARIEELEQTPGSGKADAALKKEVAALSGQVADLTAMLEASTAPPAK